MKKFVFVGAMGRSGTSLIRRILDSHPKIAAGPEFDPLLGILEQYRETKSKIEGGRIAMYLTIEEARTAFRELIEHFLIPYANRRGKEIIVEKTPSNIWYFNDLAELFPEAKFIHLVRDGRDVVCSHLEVGRRFEEKGVKLDQKRAAALTDVCTSTALWVKTIEIGLSVCGEGSELNRQGRAITIRYRDLICDTEDTVKRLCTFLGVEFDPMMLESHKVPHDDVVDNLWVTESQTQKPVTSESMGRWRRDMGLKERILFAALGQKYLAEFGYETDTSWVVRDFKGTQSELQHEIQLANEEALRLDPANKTGK